MYILHFVKLITITPPVIELSSDCYYNYTKGRNRLQVTNYDYIRIHLISHAERNFFFKEKFSA